MAPPHLLRQCLVVISILTAIILIPLIFFLIRTSRAATNRESLEKLLKNITISLAINAATGETTVVCRGPEIILLAVGKCGREESRADCENHVNCLLKKYKAKGRREVSGADLSLVKCAGEYMQKIGSCEVVLRFEHGAVICETRGGGKIVDFFTTIQPFKYTLASIESTRLNPDLLEVKICREIWFKNESRMVCLSTKNGGDLSKSHVTRNSILAPQLRMMAHAPLGQLECLAHPMFLRPIKLFAVMKSGAKIDVDQDWLSMVNLVALKNLTGITCAAQPYRKNGQDSNADTPWLEKTLWFTVTDPIVSMKTGFWSITTVPLTQLNSSIACSFFGDLHKLKHFHRASVLFKLIQDWSRGDNLMKNSTIGIMSIEGFLTFLSSVSEQDYVCRFFEILYHPLPLSVDFVVQLENAVGPVFNDVVHGNQVDNTIGTTQTLSCGYRGNPEPMVLWFENGIEIMYSKGHHHLEFDPLSSKLSQNNFTSSLHFTLPHTLICNSHIIMGVTENTFTCLVINVFGNASHHFVILPAKYCDHRQEDNDVEKFERNKAVVLNTFKFQSQPPKSYSNDTCRFFPSGENYSATLQEDAMFKELTRNPLTVLVGFLTLILLIVKGPWLYTKIGRKCGFRKPSQHDMESTIIPPPEMAEPDQSQNGGTVEGGSASSLPVLIQLELSSTSTSFQSTEVAANVEEQRANYLNNDNGARSQSSDLTIIETAPSLITTIQAQRIKPESSDSLPTYDEFAPPAYIELKETKSRTN